MTPLARRLRTFADASICAVFVTIGALLVLDPFYLVKVFGLAVIIFAFLLLAEERADYRRGE
jgi:hypothetical protein